MRKTKAEKTFSKRIKSRLDEKQDDMLKQPAVFGDGLGNVVVPNLNNFSYCTIGDKVLPVFNNRVPAQSGVKIWVGYAPEEPRLFQVLSTRSEDPTGGQATPLGYAPAKRYEHNAEGGGQDPLAVHLRAFTPLKLGVSPTGGLLVDLFRGYVWSGTTWIAIARQNVDMTTHIPATTGKAALVLVTIDDTGTVISTKGSEVDLADLVLSDLPAIPADTVFVCGAVRVYYGQTTVREGRINTDFVDLRFPGWRASSGGGSGDVVGPASAVDGDFVTFDTTTGKLIKDSGINQQLFSDTKDPTGWVNGSAIGVSYDSSTRKITLTGTLQYYWRGVKHTLASPWVSSAHDNTNGIWYLSSTDGSTFTWSDTVWAFDAIMVAFVNFGAANKFAICETHGLMGWETHRELHGALGTYRSAGGTLGSYTPASTTAGDRRPTVTQTTLEDEDNQTVNPALTSDLYTQIYFAQDNATNTLTYAVDVAEIVPVLAANPYYNAWDGAKWNQTLMANNSYSSVWLIAVPVTDDAASQKYRYLWLEGQSNGTLAAQQALTPSALNLGNLSSEAAEFVFLAQVIIRYTGGNWVITSVTNLLGNRFIQVGATAGAFLSSVTTDGSLTGDGLPATPLSQASGATTATAAGTTTLTVASNRVQEFTGTTTQDVVLPVVTTLRLGHDFVFLNNSTGVVTIKSSGGNAVQVIAAGQSAILRCILITGTTAASWSSVYSMTPAQIVDLTDGGTTTLHTHSISSALPFVQKKGMVLSNNGTDANNDIDVAVGGIRDSTDAVNIVLSSAITKRLDAGWAVGTNQGGLDTGSKANSTWYHVFAILRSDTGVVDVLFSTSLSSPTMPANYDYRRRIGSVKTDGSGNILAFYEFAYRINWKVTNFDLFGGTATTRTLFTAAAPSGLKTLVFGVAFIIPASAASMFLYDPDISSASTMTLGVYAANSPNTLAGFTVTNAMTNTSAQLAYYVNNGAGYFVGHGYEELWQI